MKAGAGRSTAAHVRHSEYVASCALDCASTLIQVFAKGDTARQRLPILLRLLPQQKKKKQAVCAACLYLCYASRACITSLWTRSFIGSPA